MNDPRPTRRAVLRTAGSAAAAAAALSACGGSTGAAGTPAATTPAAAAGTVLVPVADVPVGGGVVLTDLALVVTQPTAGQFAGYSAICPHQRCPVSAVKDGFIECTCHGSRFAVATGAPTPDSPAKAALTPAAVTVSGNDVVTA